MSATTDPMTDPLERLARLDTTLVSDALDALGLPAGTGCLTGLGSSTALVGRARTVRLAPAGPERPAGPHIATEAIDAAGPGDVVVVANDGRTDVSCWGGLLTLGSVMRGVRGVIADGACRDLAEARALDFQVFARGVTPRTARTRLRQVEVGGRVEIDSVPVADGDFVVADDSGVVFVPADHVGAVLDRAEWAAGQEAAIAADIRAGVGIAQAMHDARLTAATDENAPRATTSDEGAGR